MNTPKESKDQQDRERLFSTGDLPVSTDAEPASERSEFPKELLGKLWTVNYRRLKNLGNYENETVEASAYVLHTQDPAEVLEELRVWVHAQLGISMEDVRQQLEVHRMMQNDVWALQAERDDLREQIERMRTWAAQYGMPLVRDLGETLPF